MPLYPRNYVNEKGSHKNRKVGLVPRLSRVKEMAHTTRNFGFWNCHLQLKSTCMRHMQLQICVVA